MQSTMAPIIRGSSVPVIPMPVCVSIPRITSPVCRRTYGYSRVSCAHPETRLCVVFAAEPAKVFAAALILEWTAGSPARAPHPGNLYETGRAIDSVSLLYSNVWRLSGQFQLHPTSVLHRPPQA